MCVHISSDANGTRLPKSLRARARSTSAVAGRNKVGALSFRRPGRLSGDSAIGAEVNRVAEPSGKECCNSSPSLAQSPSCSVLVELSFSDGAQTYARMKNEQKTRTS